MHMLIFADSNKNTTALLVHAISILTDAMFFINVFVNVNISKCFRSIFQC